MTLENIFSLFATVNNNLLFFWAASEWSKAGRGLTNSDTLKIQFVILISISWVLNWNIFALTKQEHRGDWKLPVQLIRITDY